ncbi:MAG TPA: GTP cyclohydrolase I FolE [Chitinophagaceae bacterium]|nr:GTP cyclohydrolase I FolE [Chitinophagaceae bacterium]HNE93824.1 GTP cyclohydrolase I FolE [Chitinophagaceae bacterium]HNF28744.1 GTP cyclohydrolase I FolE [Chitinophagaceae bacterium]HNJ58704.1 GTP cyclohydrolase I FolE [Chitinophagaceae bacterium]HNM33462.1 GTP cyclohydrolase I FolE [Chitinophagaceae bacterium]
MKQKETLLNIRLNAENKIELSDMMIDEMGNDHVSTSVDTPIREDAFELSDSEKVKEIEKHFTSIMQILGLDLTDDSLKGTPKRVAKMYVQEIFNGLNPANKPSITLFENKYGYNEMLVEKNISFYTCCEHHFVPFNGKAHIAYINSGKVIGLSKLNRIVKYFAKRPQVQERLTMQIGKELQKVLNTLDVAVLIDAKHLCVASRGVEDDTSSTVTAFYGGAFNEEDKKTEFLKYLNLETKY